MSKRRRASSGGRARGVRRAGRPPRGPREGAHERAPAEGPQGGAPDEDALDPGALAPEALDPEGRDLEAPDPGAHGSSDADEVGDAEGDAAEQAAGAPAHLPVLIPQVLALLAPALEARGGPDGPDGPDAAGPLLVDGTLGAGGHAAALLAAHPRARLLGLDRDADALALAAERLAPFGERVRLVHAPYDEAARAARELGLGPVAAALLDLGVSSMQLDRPERGFSFLRPGPLDMRMGADAPESAADLVARLDERALADAIYQLGEERFSRRIARAIVAARAVAPLRTTERLAEVVRRAVPGGGRPARLHPATRTFQALRMLVNDELGQLERGLPALFEALAPGGRLAVIAFHSLEDRPVKQAFRALHDAGRGALLTKKPLVADEDEVARNPRARSAKLRGIARAAP